MADIAVVLIPDPQRGLVAVDLGLFLVAFDEWETIDEVLSAAGVETCFDDKDADDLIARVRHYNNTGDWP